MAKSKGRPRGKKGGEQQQQKKKAKEGAEQKTVAWQSFFSERYQREYYYEPNLKLVTWIRPDEYHPEGVANDATEAVESLEQPAVVYGRRVSFQSGDGSAPSSRRNSLSATVATTSRGLAIHDEAPARPRGKRNIWRWILGALIFLCCAVGGVYFTLLLPKRRERRTRRDEMPKLVVMPPTTSRQQGTSEDSGSESKNSVEHAAPSTSTLSSASRTSVSMTSEPQVSKRQQQPKSQQRSKLSNKPKPEVPRQSPKRGRMQSKAPRQPLPEPQERDVPKQQAVAVESMPAPTPVNVKTFFNSRQQPVAVDGTPEPTPVNVVTSSEKLDLDVPTPERIDDKAEKSEQVRTNEHRNQVKSALSASQGGLAEDVDDGESVDAVLARTCKVPFAHLFRGKCRKLAKKQPLVDVHSLLDNMMQ